MKSIIRPLGASMLLGCATAVWAQSSGAKIDRVDIKFVGPASVSEQFIRSNLKTKSGVTYTPTLTQDDIHTLYGTGQFYTIRVSVNQADDGGVVLTYLVQVRPRITEIKLNGNKKLSDSKLKKKITVKVGDALDEQKLFTIVQDIKELYEKYGYSDTTVKYSLNIDEITGHGVVNFDIVESLKVKIVKVEVIGAAAFKQKQLTGELKTSKHWMFSWITGSGVFKQEDFDGDRDRLTTYYRNHGYLDFEIKDVKIEHPTPKTMTVKFYVYEGRQYRVGTVKFTGNKIYSEADIKPGLKLVHDFQHSKAKLGTHNLPMDSGDIFTPSGLNKDLEAVQDFYGSKGHIEVAQGDALRVVRVPNVETGTMDVEFQIDEGQPSSVQKIEIRGETFDMVRVKISQKRLEGLDYFEKVDMQPEPTDPPIAGEKDLIINVKEKNTGNFTLGAGFSSVDSLVGFAEMTQGNFDLFHPPYFTGGGQRMRVRLQIGTQRQDYEISFVEPWFLNRKLQLGVDLYRHQLNFESPNNIYDETRTGAKVSLTKALGSDFLLGSVSYGVEDVGISLNGGWHDALSGTPGGNQSGGHGGGIGPGNISNSPYPGGAGANVPQAILDEQGDHLYQRIGASLAYDTRNSTQLPNHGQRTELLPELSVGDKNFYKLEAKTSWFFPGFFKGHVLEADGRVGVAQSLSGGDVPFYDRYYLGGLYSMRGFKFRNVAPRDPTYNTIDNPNMPNEPIGGDSFWFGSLEYSLPILEKDGGMGLRFAMFYDIGAVSASAYSFSTSYDDNWGLGIRLNIPHLGPLRLDYGIPITHDSFNGSSGKFQFGVGFERPF